MLTTTSWLEMAVGGVKRKHEDFDVSEVDCPRSDVNIHGIVTQLSPVKQSRSNSHVKYFDGKLSDGKKTLKLIAFDPLLRTQMDKSRLDHTPIAIMNCQVKENTKFLSASNEKLEILASSRSKVQTSPHKLSLPEDFEALDPDSQPSPNVTVQEIDDLSVGQQVTITCKVVQLDDPTPVQNKSGKLLTKQESIVADVTDQIRVVLWETEIGKLIIDQCYKLENITIRMYNDIKYLSISSTTLVTPIDDIGQVSNDSNDQLIPETGNRILQGSIAAVVAIDTYSSCINCKSKVNLITSTMGQCSRCNIKLNYTSCKRSRTANLIFQTDDQTVKITMFENELKNITSSATADSMEEKLFSLNNIKVCINNKNIVYSASLI